MPRLNTFTCFLFFAVSFSFLPLASAQEAEDEMLTLPIRVPNEVGVYKGINSLPTNIRRSKPFARWLHELRHYCGTEGLDNTELRIQAFEQSKADLLRDEVSLNKVAGSLLPVFSDPWTNVGPINTAGCTKALAFHPQSGDTMYAGAAGGGVWKSVNAGALWFPLTDNVIPDLAVASIAVDPLAPNTIYVGTGDPSVASDGLPGTGIYKSIDAGLSWTHIAQTTLTGTVNKVLVHPENSDIVFACAYQGNRGLYRSVDRGATFLKVFPTSKSADGIIWDVVAGQSVPGGLVMYLVEGNNPHSSSAECGIYRSTDDGLNWQKLSGAGLPSGTDIGKSALAVPSGNKGKVFCLMANPDGDIYGAGLWRSDNSGSSFTKISTVPAALFNPYGNGAQGWYDLYLAVSPQSNPNDTIYVGGVNAYYSFNSGATWHSYSDYSGTKNVHVDHQSIAIDPLNSRNVLIGTDGGVYRSTDAGQNWVYRSKGFQTTRFYHIALDAGDQRKALGGSQDQGTYRVVSGQGPAFLFGGDGFQPIVDPTNSNTIYTEAPFGDLYKSTNGGAAFTQINNPAFLEGTADYEESDWDTPFAMSSHNSAVLFEGRQRLWQSTNGGTNWSTLSPTFSYNGSRPYLIQSLSVSPANSGTIWLGLEAGKIRMTNNGGATWLDRSVGTPGENVSSIVCDPNDANISLASFEVYGTLLPRVMRTSNGGANWVDVSGSNGRALPGVPVNCVALDSTNPASVWYAATDNGIYFTRDAGLSWSIAGAGLGLAPCTDVQVHANKVTIKVGTHGRGIWESNVNIIPVDFIGLSALKTATGTQLDWKTQTEIRDSGFWVQRSIDHKPFENIFFQQGARNSNAELSYSYFDPKHDNGGYIFRLMRIDLDGTTHVSNIAEVRYGPLGGASELAQSFPNP
ncbi:MAG: hypothetical protein ABI778_04510, partial [Ignavibacteriota bacterium]